MHVLAGDALTKENVHILPCCNNDVNCANINSNISRQRPHTWPGLSSSAVSVSKTWGLNWTPQGALCLAFCDSASTGRPFTAAACEP